MDNTRPRFDIDPEEFRRLGYRMIDGIVDHLRAETEDPVLPKIKGEEMRARLDAPPPRRGRDTDLVLNEAIEILSSFSRKNGHPRFFGYVSASADPVGMLGDALASAANQNLTAWRSSPAATEIERQVVRWLDEALGFSGPGHGLLLSGGSAANAHGIACAVADAEQRVALDQLTFYHSSEAHLSLPQAARGLGLRGSQLRKLPVDHERRLSVPALEQALAKDLEAGWRPACVCASAGTANTGAIDALDEIATLCQENGVWFHIDGAYGAPAALTEPYAHLKLGFSKANSMSVDPHKWLFAPLDVGCVLVRDPRASQRAFARTSEYIAVAQTETSERFAFFDHGPELSRRFRALKVWMILKARGFDALAEEIQRHIMLRQWLDQRVAQSEELELLGSDLSISCFRYGPGNDSDTAELDQLNQKILDSLVASGSFLLSPTTLEGRLALRICIVNFRTQMADVDFLIDEVLRLGKLYA